jgi:hypothetical protein
MQILKNRHMVIAALVAPLLAVMAYYAVDLFVGEKPFAAKAGESYSLVEKPNCRYASGSCGLKNGDFELTLVPEWTGVNTIRLTLQSAFGLDGVMIAPAGDDQDNAPPTSMDPADETGRLWTIDLDNPDVAQGRLRIVAASNQALWYGDVALNFAGYGKDP